MKKIMLSVFAISLSMSLFAQTNAQREEIQSKYDVAKLNQLSAVFKQKAEQRKKAALAMAAIKGWEEFLTNPDGSVDELMDISPDGSPIYFSIQNVDASRSTRTNHLNTGGSLGLNLDGKDMVVNVWDGGAVRTTHQEYDGPGGNNRVTVIDGVTATNQNSYHSNHVTGTIMASGVVANAKGMAWQAKARTAEWGNDLSEAAAEAANGMLLSNHSYGINPAVAPDYYFGAYIEESRDWDELMYNAPYYLMVVAAGNDGSNNLENLQPLDGESSYDKLTGHTTCKNNLAVANAQDADVNQDGSLNSVVINSSSSQGPTDDLRIKPEITGNGTSLYSTDSGGDNAYATLTGTSMASPNVTGSLVLLQEHHQNLNGSFMRASTLKGLVLHTADDAGMVGPDAIYGWGLLNTKVAAEAITAEGNSSIIDELTLASGQSYSITVNATGAESLIASICWTDVPGVANTGSTNDQTPVLVNDLDVRVVKNSTTYFPYKLTGVKSNAKADNNVDPYERIEVENAVGTYTITVTHKGSLSGGSQNFSLIVTGISAEPIVCNADVPSNVSEGVVQSTAASLTWDAIPGASFDVRYREDGSTTWNTLTVTSNSVNITGLTPETTYEAQVRSICDGGEVSVYSSSVAFTTSEIPLNYCASQGNNSSDEFIQSVEFGAFSNVSGNNGGYRDYTSSVISVTKEESTGFVLTPGFNGSSYNETWKLFADLNRDGDFDDVGETLYTSNNTSSAVSGSITIPASAITGNTRLRVSMKYNGASTPCESFSYGEVEDYTLQISNAGPEVCDAPSSVNASNITENNLTVNWSAMSSAVTYNVDFRAVGAANWSTSNVTGTSKAFNGLDAETTYEFRVQTVCSEGSSNYSSIVSATTDAPAPPAYCSSAGTAGSEWIEQVILGNVNNVSNSNGGYGDFTAQVVNATQGEGFNFTLNPGFSSSLFFGENTQPEYWRIYIDYNGDMDFDDAGELAFDAGETSTGNVTGSISIPANAIVGTTRVRVSMKRSSGAAACGNIGNGEVEDYTISIAEPASPTCDAPTGLSTSNITSSSFTLNWSAAANADTYAVDMRVSGGAWTTYSTAVTSYTFSGLTASTNYEFRVATVCSFGTSAYSNVGSVSTLSDNPNPVTYCSSNGGTADEWIASVNIAGLNNNSGNDGGYGDYTTSTVFANLGQTVSFTLNPGFNSGLFGTTTYPEYWRIWIDYNQDGDFDDAGELAFDAGGTSSSSVSGSLVIPASANVGNTRMRVSMKYNAAPSSCESFSYGEVEDYTISIGSAAQRVAGSSGMSTITSSQLNLVVAPNPTAGYATIALNLVENKGEVTLSVMDLTGRVIQTTKLDATDTGSLQNVDLDLSNESPGTYLIVVQTASGDRKVERLVKY